MLTDDDKIYLEQTAQAIAQELLKPENTDLAFAMINFDGPSLIFFFDEPMTFENYVLQYQNIQKTEKISEAYDQYVKRTQEANKTSPINKSQSDRFQTIINRFNDGSWSGGVSEIIFKKTQNILSEHFQGNQNTKKDSK